MLWLCKVLHAQCRTRLVLTVAPAVCVCTRKNLSIYGIMYRGYAAITLHHQQGPCTLLLALLPSTTKQRFYRRYNGARMHGQGECCDAATDALALLALLPVKHGVPVSRCYPCPASSVMAPSIPCVHVIGLDLDPDPGRTPHFRTKRHEGRGA